MREVSFGRRLTMLASAAQAQDVAVTLAHEDRSETQLTWHDLEARSNAFGRHLDSLGISEGSLVVVALPTSIDHLVASFGCWKAGASVLPLRYDLPEWERERMLKLAAPAAVIAEWTSAATVSLTRADVTASADIGSEALGDRVPQPKRVIASSGSTGQPKLIVTPGPGVVEVEEGAEPSGPDRTVQLGASPLYHANGWMGGGPGGILTGKRTVLMERFEAEHAVALIEAHRVQEAILVPTMLQRIARLDGIADRDLSTLQHVLCGGASVPEWVVRAWLKLISPSAFVVTYGGSESLGSVRADGVEWLERPGTTGRGITCDIQIHDEQGQVVPAGTVGEIYLRRHGTTVPFEYLGMETPAAAADGYRTMGDLGWLDDDGYLFIVDRRQDMIVSGGANVFAAEVEGALSEHPDVVDQVVIGLPDPEWGHRVHAIVQLVPGGAGIASGEGLRAFCRDRLAAYKVPKTIEVVDRIPRSEAGKVNRPSLIEARTTAEASSSPTVS